MKAVIIGATGLVGTELLKKILNDNSFDGVTSISRRRPQQEHPKLTQVIVSTLEDLPLRAVDLQGEVYFCCLGTTIKAAGSQQQFRKIDQRAVGDFARIAKNHQAKSFVLVSAQGAAPGSKIFYSRVKGEVEQELNALGLASLTIFRPSLLIGDRKEKRPAERFLINLFKILSPVLPASVLKRAGTEVSQLADRMIELAVSSRPGVTVVEAWDISFYDFEVVGIKM
ncbi:MAG TPA: NAD(P)H-binding protein [Bacteriovoracaceae bacterium]|nr:NAD(P)H-binding protein [Bacteriovoracaceae bacterium]